MASQITSMNLWNVVLNSSIDSIRTSLGSFDLTTTWLPWVSIILVWSHIFSTPGINKEASGVGHLVHGFA